MAFYLGTPDVTDGGKKAGFFLNSTVLETFEKCSISAKADNVKLIVTFFL